MSIYQKKGGGGYIANVLFDFNFMLTILKRVSEQLQAKRLKAETSSGRLYATALSNTVTQ